MGAEYEVAGAFVTVDPEMRLETRIDGVEAVQDVQRAAPGSRIVGTTVDALPDRAGAVLSQGRPMMGRPRP